MRTQLIRFIFPSLILTATGLGLFAPLTHATPAIAKKEGKGGTAAKCVTCHVAMGKKDLNPVGECYKKDKSLDKCAK